LRRWLQRTLAAVVLGAGAASLLAIFAEQSWLADLAVNFRLQYLAVGLLAAPWCAWRRQWPLAAAALVAIVLNAAPVMAVFSAPSAERSAATPPTTVPLRIASANVLFLNHDHAAVLAWARAANPEVLLFLETTAEWRRALAPLEAEYPHHRYVTDHSHHGLLLLSRWPLSDVVTRPPDEANLRPVLFSTVTRQGVPLRLAAMHATWPMRPTEARQRARDLAAMAAEAARRGPLPFIGIGDLNISPFSPHYTAMLRAGGLRSAAAGRGWQPTWPAFFLPLGIQIDHALVSPEVQVRAFARGPRNGSDHRPIIIDVIIPATHGTIDRS
jgi:endonuclease/exonuclease/phosphatase (EEP) superfamily protein YafD